MNRITCLADFEAMYDQYQDPVIDDSCIKMHERCYQISKWAHDLQFDGCILEADELFEQIDIHRLDSQIIAALFRSLWHVRPILTNWPDKYDEATDLLMYRGHHRVAQELMRFSTYN